MKKIIHVLSSIAVVSVFLVSPVYAQAASLTLNPASGQLNKGCDVTVTVELDTAGAQTDGTDVILTYEPAKMTLAQNDITNGKVYADYPGNSVDPATGKISISGIASVSQAYNGKGTFATMKFKIPAAAPDGPATLRFDFDPADPKKTTDSNVVERGTIADVLTTATNGSYTIGSGTCTGGVGAPGASIAPTLPIGNTPSSDSALPAAGILDNTVLVTSVGMLLVIMGIAGIALL